MGRTRLTVPVALLVLGIAATLAACGGSAANGLTAATSAGGAGATTSSTIPASANPVRIVFNGEITGPLVFDAAAVKKGIRTALQMIGNQLAGYPVVYTEQDNKSDPLLAVQQTRAVVQMDTNDDKKPEQKPVDFICGPLSSSDVAAVTFFLAGRTDKLEQIPECAVTGQPSENITTADGLGFVPNGIYSSWGYYLGKFAAEDLHYKTANCIHDSDRIAQEMQSGFERGFIAGGGSILSLTYVPSTTIDFTTYFSQMQQADCTFSWVRGTGAIPFARQYYAAGMTGQLLVPMSSNYGESQLEYLQALGLNLDIISCDVYSPLINNAKNSQFISAYQALYPGEYPTPEAFGGWQAVMLYAQAVNQLAAGKKVGALNSSGKPVDPRNPVDVIATMASLTMDTPAGSITMKKYGKTWVADRDFYILRSKDMGGGRIAWVPLYTYTQVLMGQ